MNSIMREMILLVLLICVVFARSAPKSKALAEFIEANKKFNISEEISELMFLDAPDLITRFGYPVEVHKATTPDGYILEMHRLPHGKLKDTKRGKKSVVFLMHGLLASSIDYVVMGPGISLALLLADEGYDVWLGNARGNYYSRNHVSLNPDIDSQFWLFSWDEIGHIDLPTSIDYILKLTGEKQLHYVGHSQGGTTFLVMNSLRPEYNKKIKSFHGCAPSTYNTYKPFREVLVIFLSKITILSEKTIDVLGPFEYINKKQAHIMFSYLLCNGAPVYEPKCINLIRNLYLAELQNINTTLLPLIISNVPAGASIMQGLHYVQCVREDTFARYNFNNLTNLNKYGSVDPTEYDVTKVTAPTFLYYGMSDTLVHWKDILKLAKKLPNVQQLFKVREDNFNHADFMYRSDVKILLYDEIIKNIRKMH